MTLYNWICLLGVPSAVGAVWAYIYNLGKQTKAVKAGLQALLRAKMVSENEAWKKADAVPLHVKESFDQVYCCYHALGKNGVMDGIHEEFMKKGVY